MTMKGFVVIMSYDINSGCTNGNVIHFTGSAALTWSKLDSTAEHSEQGCPFVNASVSVVYLN